MENTENAQRALNASFQCCLDNRHEFIMPEHLLFALVGEPEIVEALEDFGVRSEALSASIKLHLDGMERVPDDADYQPEVSQQMAQLLNDAAGKVLYRGDRMLDIPHLMWALSKLNESWATFMLREHLQEDYDEFISQLFEIYGYVSAEDKGETADKADWKQLVTCMNDYYDRRNPLVGREAELRRTIQVLCRCDKNNPLHVGEPGVGKTAIVWGLVRLIEEGRVPERLRGSKVYQIETGGLLAGTQFRGEFEKRIKEIMDGIQKESDNNIVYIDEIHTMIGAGSIGESSMDASNMLKPYLESGAIRFIGSTTYEEFNRHFANSKGFARRFQQIDILEPSVEETKNILRQLLPRYEAYHGVKYTAEAVDFAAEASAKHILGRFLPDKAIDLLDEAGAAMEVEGVSDTIDKKEIADILAKTCKVDALAVAEDNDYDRLSTLSSRMLGQIYGQDEAVEQVVEAVQMARAGLQDDNKPLASLLFVGPTGVGKTEVAKVLAKELGVELIRFDMSEYTEKHSIAKLIGSPAGYVGYDDGGQLTDAIRKSPNSVLLLDEIEKAHPDIYNILLQVMDYARLTDNKGRQADFRNVVIIMTSNAGAQFASQASVGFNSSVSRGDAMLKQVKKTFKPEFINRLTASVVFHDMDRHMATLILQKKLRELESKLQARKVALTISDEAMDMLMAEGYTVEYGAREMDRVIGRRLKPIVMREILFGSLKNGGNVKIVVKDGCLSIG